MQPCIDSAIVLLYDDAASSVRLHDIIEVTGILDSERHEDGHGGASEADSWEELLQQENAEEGDAAMNTGVAPAGVRSVSLFAVGMPVAGDTMRVCKHDECCCKKHGCKMFEEVRALEELTCSAHSCWV